MLLPWFCFTPGEEGILFAPIIGTIVPPSWPSGDYFAFSATTKLKSGLYDEIVLLDFLEIDGRLTFHIIFFNNYDC